MRRDRAGSVPARGFHGRTLAALAAAALLAPSAAGAACPGDLPAVAAVPVEARTAFLRERIEAERPSAERWMRTWGVVDGVLTAGQLAAVPFTRDRSGRTVLLAGATASALGMLQIVLVPPVARAPPADRDGDACAEVAGLERALARGALHQELGAGWIAHTGNVVINAVIGAAAGLAGRRWQPGALTFAIGLALGEAQILTQPTGLVRDLERYRAGSIGLGAASLPPIGAAAGGIVSVRVTF